MAYQKQFFFIATAFIVILIFLASCQPPVVFGESQPSGIAPVTNIPKEYQGIYWCAADSATIYIDDKAFIKRKEYLIKLTRSEIDSNENLMILDGRMFVSDLEGDFPMQEKGDTITTTIVIRDTLFSIGREQLMKPFKGHLIMNTKLDENAWAVSVASLKANGLLSIARADFPENLSSLEAITPVRTLSEGNERNTQIYITPTKEQFEQILQKGVLFQGSCSEFERIIPIQPRNY